MVARREEMDGLDMIGRIMDLVKAHMSAALKADGERLQLMEAHVLRIVLTHENCTQLDVIRETRRDKAQIGKLVSTLVSRGFLLKSPDPEDARRQRLILTPDGRRVAGRSVAHRAEIARLLFAKASRGELSGILTSLAQLEASLAAQVSSRH